MANPVTDDLRLIGPRLRAARRARGLTLEDLSRLTTISVSTLSRLEAGKRQATLELLLPLTRHLGIRIDDLVDNAPRDPRVRRPVLRTNGVLVAPLSPEGSSIATYKITYPPRATMPAPRSHAGQEWLYVLSGALRLHLGGEELVLKPGEAAQFDTQVPHAMNADGGVPAEVLSIFGDEGFLLHTQPSPADEAAARD
ncbi:MAG: XRE family transcriptional regulator [Arachnia sp.]